jgi:hypothetical protein
MSFLDTSYASGSFLGLENDNLTTMQDAHTEAERMQQELITGKTAAPAVAREGASADEKAMINAYNTGTNAMIKEGIMPAREVISVTRTDPVTGLPISSTQSFGTTNAETAAILAKNAAFSKSMESYRDTGINKMRAMVDPTLRRVPAAAGPVDRTRSGGMSQKTMLIAGVAVVGLVLLLAARR